MAISGLLAGTSLARAADVPLQFVRLDLRDGRTLTNVVIKTFDAASGKLLLVADGKAMVVPVNLIPAPFDEGLKKAAPPAGATTAVVAVQSVAPRVVVMQPAPDSVERPVIIDPHSMSDSERLIAWHKEAAAAHARRYFQYEFKAGSDAIVVTELDLEMNQPQMVDGWPGRYRTTGRALLTFYESKGRSFSRSACAFEVLTEGKAGEPLKIVDFSRK